MRALGYSIWLQWKLDVRNKNMLSAYYILPIAFYLIVGAIYKEVTPLAEDSMIQAMSVLAISIAAFLGTPAPLVDFFTSDTKKTYIVGNINLGVILLTTFVSAMVHMIIVSTLIYFTAPLIFAANKPEALLAYIGWLIITMIISAVIGMVIGIASKNTSAMTMVSQLVFLPTMLLGGIMLPVYILPKVLQDAGKIFPATYSIKILNSLGSVTAEMIYPLFIIGFLGIIALGFVYKRALIK